MLPVRTNSLVADDFRRRCWVHGLGVYQSASGTAVDATNWTSVNTSFQFSDSTGPRSDYLQDLMRKAHQFADTAVALVLYCTAVVQQDPWKTVFEATRFRIPRVQFFSCWLLLCEMAYDSPRFAATLNKSPSTCCTNYLRIQCDSRFGNKADPKCGRREPPHC